LSKCRVCPDCGLNLDFGEICDCRKKAPSEAVTSTESKDN